MKSAIKSGEITLHRAMREDVADLMTVDTQTNPSPWSQAWWLAAVVHDHVWLLRDATKRITAFIVWQTVLDEMELHLIATAPEFRRQGCATRLLNVLFDVAATQSCHRILLEVRAENLTAQQLYLAHGFQQIALRKQYYKDGSDALIMEKLC